MYIHRLRKLTWTHSADLDQGASGDPRSGFLNQQCTFKLNSDLSISFVDITFKRKLPLLLTLAEMTLG